MNEPKAAFAAFYTGNRAWLTRQAYSLCRDAHEAEDLSQATFVKMFRIWHTLDRRTELRTYLKRVVRSIYLDSRRRAGARLEFCVAEFPDDLAVAMDRTGGRDHPVGDLVARLPAVQRHVVFLRFWADLDTRESARRLGCAPGTVTGHVSRALTRLRADLPAPELAVTQP